MGCEPTEFRLAEWRRPVEWGDAIQLCAIVAPICGLFVAAALRKAFGLELPWNLILGVGLALLGAAGIVWADHRVMPAGALRLEPGRLQLTRGPRGKRDVAVDRLRFVDGNSDVLVLHFRGGRPMRIHQARLSVPLSQVQAAIVQHAGLMTNPPAGWGAVFAARLGQRLPVLLVLLGILAAIRWWLIP